MRSRLFTVASVAMLTAGAVVATPAYAGSVTGVAVGNVGSSTQVGIADAQGVIDYFIPLSQANSGVYGVTPTSSGPVGTFSDTGSGYGYNDATNDALQMYLRYDLSQLSVPAATATLSFRFDDLDLAPNNDPTGFFEDLQVHYFDGTSVQALTNTILDSGDSAALVDAGATITVDANDSNRIHLVFPGLASVINGLPTGADALYIRLDLSSKYEPGNNVRNTSERLLSSVLTTTMVPLPSAAWMGLVIMGGMGVVGKIRRKRIAA